MEITYKGVIPMLTSLDPFESIMSRSYEGSGASSFRPSPTRRIFENYWRETKEKKMQLSVKTTKGDSYNPKLSKDAGDCVLDNVINLRTDTTTQNSKNVIKNDYPNIPVKLRCIFGYNRTDLLVDTAYNKTVIGRDNPTSIVYAKHQSILRSAHTYSLTSEHSSVSDVLSQSKSVSVNPQVNVYLFRDLKNYMNRMVGATIFPDQHFKAIWLCLVWKK